MSRLWALVYYVGGAGVVKEKETWDWELEKRLHVSLFCGFEFGLILKEGSWGREKNKIKK
jgi:hypothetical protein